MSWRLSVVPLAVLAVACSDGTTSPIAHPFRASTALLPVDTAFHIRVLPNLDGNNVTVTAFNQYDVVAGYKTTGSTTQIFRSRNTIEFFTPPAGFQAGNIFPISVGINAGGWVASGIDSAFKDRAFIWWHNGGTTLLPPTYEVLPVGPGTGCGAFAINDSGYVAGMCAPNSNDFVSEWSPTGANIKNECCGVLTAITNNGYVTGYDLLEAIPRALLWAPGAAEYTVIASAEYSEGLAVNSTGSVAGWGLNADGRSHQAVLWAQGQAPRVLSHYGQAAGVDDAGNVVGFHQDTIGGPAQAYLWNVATGAHFLPGLPGGPQTAAVAISNVNPEILGWAIDAHGLKHAVIWTYPRS